jgi:hypothetical protein
MAADLENLTADPGKLTCAEFQALLPELICTGEDAKLHPHALTCDRCRALLIDLEAIAEAARKLFPGDHPWIN